MKIDELIEKANKIAVDISGTDGPERFSLHEQLHRTLEQIRQSGGRVPNGLRRLDLDLLDEEVEASFDNMPV